MTCRSVRRSVLPVQPSERMRELRRFAAVLLCAFGLVYSGRARAESAAPIELKWNALEGCPSADSVLARVRKIAGTTRATGNTLRADATVTQPSDGLFRLRLTIQYGNLAAVRNIEGKSCKDLAGAAAIALALLLSSEEPLSERDLAGPSPTPAGSTTSGPSGTNQAPEKQATPQTPAPTSPQAAEAAASTASSAEAGPPRRWHVLLVAPLAALGFGPMPQTSRGLGGAVGYSFDRWRFLAEGKIWASQHETISNWGGDFDLELNRFSVSARGCRSVFGSRFELAPCAVLSVHHLSVLGTGPNLVSGGDAVTWAAVGVGVQARLLITHWLGLVAGVDAELQLSRPEITMSLPTSGSLEPTEIQVGRLGPAAATITVGSQWIF